VARLCELNVLEQVVNVCRTTVVQAAWQSGQALSVHGWVYDVKDGLVHSLVGPISDPGAALELHSSRLKRVKRGVA
jgi:carbonic anhydrase